MSRKSNRFKSRMVLESRRADKKEALMRQVLTGIRGLRLVVELPDDSKMEFGTVYVTESDLCVDHPSLTVRAV